MQVENERKVGQGLHNMSLMSHLSVDPAALAQVSMMQGHYGANNPGAVNLDSSQFVVNNAEQA